MTPPRTPLASVVVRTLNEARHVGGVLDAVAGQTVGDGVETIVVDSGSRDGTIAIARERGARVIEIPPETFTFGRALNLGCEASAAPVVVALSGHAYPPDRDWLARLLGHFEDASVACATGAGSGPTGEPLAAPVIQDAELARRFPFWGYSNAAGGFRADLWRERPFREDMPGTEDKEWAWHWLARGRRVVLDPTLTTMHDHRRDPALDNYRRARREWRGYAMFLDVAPATVGELVREWWATPEWRLRLRPGMAASLVGQYLERRSRPR